MTDHVIKFKEIFYVLPYLLVTHNFLLYWKNIFNEQIFQTIKNSSEDFHFKTIFVDIKKLHDFLNSNMKAFFKIRLKISHNR